ncbi:MAG: undecaprenyl-diphosphatase [Elusimicrobia bacterium HGW-Elusimicrobia-1]|jgi:undecaprenyl-diphosphatase|nr:MAG: undecaprenyl-diphosphatase [Elusimicrobia bacterium HGW-Elusimicrobia-1]
MTTSLPSLSFLGIVQGLTEFLPVSSSGHLAILGAFLKLGDSSLAVSVALHLATLAAVIVFFRRRIAEAAMSPRAWLLVAAASLPTALIGLALKSQVEKIFAGRISWVYILMASTGAFLFAASKTRNAVSDAEVSPAEAGSVWKTITPLKAVAVGVVQGVAVLPGISRSGATISAALAMGIGRREAAEFSFIISIPAVAGAALLELKDALSAPVQDVSYAPMAVSMVLAFVSGLFAIGFLLKVMESRRLSYFSYYLWALAAAGIIFGR